MNEFTGFWRLVAAKFSLQNGLSKNMLGDNPSGLLVYGDNAAMAVQIHPSIRDHFCAGDQLSGSFSEIKSAFESYLAYWGSYEVDAASRSVLHCIEGSLFPNHTNIISRRFYEFADNGKTLILKTEPSVVGGDEITGVLVWSKL